MRVHLKLPVSLEGKDYKPGSHEVPDSVVNGWFFKALLKDGHAEAFGAHTPAAPSAVVPPLAASGSRLPEAASVAPMSDDSDDEIMEDDFLSFDGDEDEVKPSKTKTKAKKSSSRK